MTISGAGKEPTRRPHTQVRLDRIPGQLDLVSKAVELVWSAGASLFRRYFTR